MSASTEKKQRQAAREAGTDKKTLAEQEAAKKKAKSNRRWTLGTIGVILLIALILFLNSSFLYTHTTAISVGDAKYSPAEVSYVCMQTATLTGFRAMAAMPASSALTLLPALPD